jgi:hypothetical protein
MEHSLHLAAKHFVQTVAPHHKKQGTSAGDSEGDSDSDGGEDDNDNSKAIDAGDSLGKAIALVKQVGDSTALRFSLLTLLQIRKSPQARAFFRATCTHVKIDPLELLLWIRTRWGSLFSFLERFIKLRAVCLPSFSNLKPLSHFLTGRRPIYSPCGCQ